MADIIIPRGAAGTADGDWRIHQPMEKLRAKYCFESSMSMEFDRYGSQRVTQDFGWGNRVSGADLFVTHMMESGVTVAEAEELLKRRSQLDEALSAVPMDMPLEAAVMEGSLRENLLALFKLCRVPGSDFGKTTKWLHLKRPSLIPMLDASMITFALTPELAAAPEDGDAYAEQLLDLVIRFRAIMHHPGEDAEGNNLTALRGLADEINAEIAKYLDGLHVPVPHPKLSPVRVLDNLIWFEVDGNYQRFNFELNRDERRVEKSIF